MQVPGMAIVLVLKTIQTSGEILFNLLLTNCPVYII